MKLKALITIFAGISVFAFNSCKNDLKLNAPYKEIPSIYAVLNPQENMQVIRVNKVFLGEGDANAMAQVADSVNYQAGDLTITLERFVGGSKTIATPTGNKDVITFRDSTVITQPGAFNVNQRVYVTSDKLFTSGEYLLTVTNNKTKNVFTSRATALDSIKPSGYTPFVGPYYPAPPGTPVNSSSYIDYSSYNTPYIIRYTHNEAKIYELVMRLHYYDSLNIDPNPAINKHYAYADYVFTNQFSKDLQGNALYFLANFKGQDIMTNVSSWMSKNSLPASGIIGRKMYKIQFFVYSSTQEYADYLQYAAPSLNITQEKPLYSNFDNNAALGLFTFRSRCSIVKEMDNSFISAFAYDKNTCGYKFFTASLGLPPCP